MAHPHCSFCGNQKRPLKFYELWQAWQCYPCTERRLHLNIDLLVTVEIPAYLEAHKP